MDRVKIESVCLICPAFTDEFIWRQSLKRLQFAPVIVSISEVIKVLSQLFMIIVIIPFERSVFDRAVHTLDLAIGPWMFDFCQSAINAMPCTDTIKDVNACIFVMSEVGELDPVA